ncbi:MAG: hypothetical protein AAF889_05030 [Cyanobacteria bacterium P01_D01_bin.73]
MAVGVDEYQFYPWAACIEFQGSDGRLVQIRGLPLAARSEFQWRFQVLLQVVGELEVPVLPQDLYDQNAKFHANFDRCLELFLIPLDNVSFDQGWFLLFGDGEQERGPLSRLEFPEEPTPEGSPEGAQVDETISTPSHLLSALWSHTGSLNEAIALSKSQDIPGRRLIEVLKAKNGAERRAAMTPKERQVQDDMAALLADKKNRANQFPEKMAIHQHYAGLTNP